VFVGGELGWRLGPVGVAEGWQWGGRWGAKGVAVDLLETIDCFYYDLFMDKFTLGFIRLKIDEAIQQNPGVRPLCITIDGKDCKYIISYDTVDRTVTGVIVQYAHKKRPISLADILIK